MYNNTSDTIEIQIFGDVSLNGLFGDPQYLNTLRSSLKNLDEHLGSCDLRLVNWEAPITKSFVFNEHKNPAIATSVTSSELFCDSFSIDVACLGNNHIGDCLSEGFETTHAFLNERSISTVGAGKTIQEAQKMIVREVNGRTIGILSFTGSETNPKIDPSSNLFLNSLEDEQSVLSLIQQSSKKVDYLLINLHWGIEFIQNPSLEQRSLARKCIDEGASVIVGHHSHCLQGVEEYGKGLIFYSLGNFIFSGLKGKETYGWPSFCNRAGAYKLSINTQKIDYLFVPFTVTNSGIQLNYKTNQNIATQQKLNRNLQKSNSSYSMIYKKNIFVNWFFRLPAFLLKTKGGIFRAMFFYLRPKYFKLLFHYFSKKK